MKNSTLLRKLRRARKTLRFMAGYFDMQASFAAKGVISPCRDWQETYKDVSEMTKEWCLKAMRESSPTPRSPIKDPAPRGMGPRSIRRFP